MGSFKKIMQLMGIGCLLGMPMISACSKKSDEERILTDINSSSVHLMVGLKYVLANPKQDPAITELQDSLHSLLQKTTHDITDITTLGKIAYQAKAYGAQEVSRGRKSDFLFIASILPSAAGDIDVPKDHGITLSAFYLAQFNPAAPLLISDNSMLYEAWMAGAADFHNEHLNSLLRAAQAKTFAANEYCTFAQEQTAWLMAHPLKPVDINVLKESVNQVAGLERAAAHAPQAAPIFAAILLAPALVEIAPGASRVFAHLETAKCFNKIDRSDEALQQQSSALNVLVQMGFPAADLALFSAAIAYKRGDMKLCAAQLKQAKSSQHLDARTQADLTTLAESIENPNPDLLQRYFTDASTGLIITKLIHQRLNDTGAYTDLAKAVNLEQGLYVFNEMNKLSPSDALQKASKLFN